MNFTPTFQPRLVPRLPARPRTERERLLRTLEQAEGRWPVVWQHMAEKLVEFDAKRITKLF